MRLFYEFELAKKYAKFSLISLISILSISFCFLGIFLSKTTFVYLESSLIDMLIGKHNSSLNIQLNQQTEFDEYTKLISTINEVEAYSLVYNLELKDTNLEIIEHEARKNSGVENVDYDGTVKITAFSKNMGRVSRNLEKEVLFYVGSQNFDTMWKDDSSNNKIIISSSDDPSFEVGNTLKIYNQEHEFLSKFKVIGTTKFNVFDESNIIYIYTSDIVMRNAFPSLVPDTLEIKLKKKYYYAAEELKHRLENEFPGLVVATWTEDPKIKLFQDFFEVFATGTKAVSFTIIFITVLLISSNLFNFILRKKMDLQILSHLGSHKGSIYFIFYLKEFFVFIISFVIGFGCNFLASNYVLQKLANTLSRDTFSLFNYTDISYYLTQTLIIFLLFSILILAAITGALRKPIKENL